ncbi:MAG: hypothetical protein OET55_10070 [Desulfuromonadales bacterium]|jgi:hypothetical protein|nr:hypothetical protein [Desulfuromonadales bacterium]MDH3961599.1 hypothetical protein [Desulfuromonadales bacterium]MDH4025844.1 hypothetical protein [Desulfuromonadales bacterium]
MYENNYLQSLLLLAGLLLLPVTAIAVPGAVHDVHRLPANDEFQDTIENRCTICHTRGRVDKALGQEEDLDVLLQRMIERGAIISERDRNVLGTFWGSPLKAEEPSSPPTE